MSEVREVIVWTTEIGARAKAPEPRCDLPFLAVAMDRVEETSSDEPNQFQRKYHYRVTFRTRPPDGTFAGTLSVEDPWNPGHVEKIDINGRVNPPIRVIPASLTVDGGDHPAGLSGSTLVVIATSPDARITVEPESGETGPWRVDRLDPAADARMATFAVRRKAGRVPEPGVHRLICRASGAGEVIVPLTVKKDGVH